MSPSEQFLFLAEKLDKGQEQTREALSELQKQNQTDRHALRNDMQSGLGRVQTDMQVGFGKVQAELSELRRDLIGADRRLLVVETERKSEANAAAKRATWISLAIGLIWSVIQFLFGWMDKRG